MTINITHRGLELTPAITEHIHEKMTSLAKYEDHLDHLDIEVGMTSHHHQKGDIFFCKVGASVHGDVIRLEKEEQDLYKAIDKVKDHLRVELADRKERIRERAHGKYDAVLGETA